MSRRIVFRNRGYGDAQHHPREGQVASVVTADPSEDGLVVKFDDGSLTWVHTSEADPVEVSA